MELLRFFLPSNNHFLDEYREKGNHPYFHYPYRSVEGDTNRLRELKTRTFPRKQLSAHIRNYMGKFSLSKEALASLMKLEREDSVVVIGGQQAGLLTGPMYTIYKMITIVLLAKEKEEKLGIPVVPVFWVAGEDHDVLEVNHVFVPDGNRLKKKQYEDTPVSDKRMVSKRLLDKKRMRTWYEGVVSHYGESDHSKDLLTFLESGLEIAETYTDFFVAMANRLFQRYGLLFIDSSHPELRKLESDYFCRLIEKGETVAEALKNRQRTLIRNGWQQTIETGDDCFHLFYEMDGQRQLLYFSKDGRIFSGNKLVLSKEELLAVAKGQPETLSNNVVTRPLMQEFLFPTIAFVAGPGEMSYWAELKDCFEQFDMKIPPVVPRLNVTLLERNIEREVRELGLEVERVLSEGTDKERKETLEQLKDQELDAYIIKRRREMEGMYKELADRILQFDPGLAGIVAKNEQFVLDQLVFLQRKVEEAVERRHSLIFEKFERIESRLRPFEGLQERCWNITYFLNRYGLDFVDRLMDLPFDADGSHYVVKL